MRLRFVILLIALCWIQGGYAQAGDTLQGIPPLQEDSVLTGAVEPLAEEVDYLTEGYYDTIPRMEGIPHVDSAAYPALMQRYRGEEFAYGPDNTDKISLFRKIFDRLGRFLERILPSPPNFQFTDLVYQLLGVAALLVFLWIMYRVLFSGKRLLVKDRDEQAADDEVKFVEKHLLEVDLARYIEQAKDAHNYALAIRYLNLLNIQLLAKRELIRWKYSKTHVELLEEIENEELKRDFGRNVNIYNRVWYGNMTVDRARYETYAPYFLTFQTKWQ